MLLMSAKITEKNCDFKTLLDFRKLPKNYKRDNPQSAYISTQDPTTNYNNLLLELELLWLLVPDLPSNRSWLKYFKCTQSYYGASISSIESHTMSFCLKKYSLF